MVPAGCRVHTDSQAGEGAHHGLKDGHLHHRQVPQAVLLIRVHVAQAIGIQQSLPDGAESTRPLWTPPHQAGTAGCLWLSNVDPDEEEFGSAPSPLYTMLAYSNGSGVSAPAWPWLGAWQALHAAAWPLQGQRQRLGAWHAHARAAHVKSPCMVARCLSAQLAAILVHA